MSRFLLAALPAAGHVRPMLPVAAELVRRGHDVHLYVGTEYAELARSTGAAVSTIVHGLDVTAASTAALAAARAGSRPGPQQLAYDMEHFFVAPIPGVVRDLRRVAEDFRPDVLVGDFGSLGIAALAELTGLPLAMVGITPLSAASVDTAPFGLGLAPVGGPLGRLRNRALNRLMKDVLLRGPQATFNRVRGELGLPPVAHLFLDHPVRAADVYLQGTVPSFEYPRSDLPASVRFVGTASQRSVDTVEPPAWWDELATARRVVLVTQGTVATDPDNLLRPTVEALAGDDVLVVAATGEDPEVALPTATRPANVRAERFVPFAALLPHVDVMVTNGGYGGVQMALAAGVPLVVAGRSEDKAEVTARVAWSGTGVDLRRDRPAAAAVGRAVRRVLDDPAYARRAGEIGAELGRYDATTLQADTITALVGVRPRARA